MIHSNRASFLIYQLCVLKEGRIVKRWVGSVGVGVSGQLYIVIASCINGVDGQVLIPAVFYLISSNELSDKVTGYN